MEELEELEEVEEIDDVESEQLEIITEEIQDKYNKKHSITKWIYGIILTPCIAYLIWLFFFLGKQILNR